MKRWEKFFDKFGSLNLHGDYATCDSPITVDELYIAIRGRLEDEDLDVIREVFSDAGCGCSIEPVCDHKDSALYCPECGEEL